MLPCTRTKLNSEFYEIINEFNSDARKDWNWKPDYDLDSMTEDMIANLRIQHTKGLI